MKTKQVGFTLIELIIVIIVLGILAVTAAPRFIDISTDAKVAKLESIASAIKDGTTIMYAKALLEKKADGAATLTLDNGVDVTLHSGYPIGDWSVGVRYLIGKDAVGWSDNNVACNKPICASGRHTSVPSDTPVSITGTGKAVRIFLSGDISTKKCMVYYINNEDGNPPIIGVSRSEC